MHDPLQTLQLHSTILQEWSLGPTTLPTLKLCTNEEQERLLKAALRAPRQNVILLGMGNGASARHLAYHLPPARTLTICELTPERVRNAAPYDWIDEPHCLALDSSPRALLIMLHACKRNPREATVLVNPELTADEHAAMRALQRLLVTTECIQEHVNADCTQNISLATILHPEEPGLENFFAQIPDKFLELVVFWDAENVPAHTFSAQCPTRHFARRINKDFAAQRNAALAETQGRWIFFLDGDERLTAEGWQNLAQLACIAEKSRCGAVAWPRLTLWPDANHALIGLGLWPDLQVRLIRKTHHVHFERPVHEVLHGYEDFLGIVPGEHILHYSRLLKNNDAIRAKLAIFDAAGRHMTHRLNEEYPCVPVEHILDMQAALPPRTLLRLKQA